MITYISFFLAGLLLLTLGAEGLIRGATGLAFRYGISAIVVGLTVVAFGTSLPEAVVSILASVEDKPAVALGNVVGSNIFNIAFILGLSALLRPLKVEARSLVREVPFVIGSSVLLWLLGKDGSIGRFDAACFLGLFVFFLWVCFRSPKETLAGASPPASESGGIRHLLLIAGGLVCLTAGAKAFVWSSVGLARMMRVSELVIGLTLVAVGTSVPELFTSVLASVRGKDDISVGNIMGSNIFNVLFVLGMAASIRTLPINPSLFEWDIPVMILLSLATVPVLKTGFVISRIEGGVLVFSYLCYVYWLCTK